jgi:hypothetical protein
MKEELEIIGTIWHPKCEELSHDIIKIVENGKTHYYFDEDGDWYNDSWCDNPEEDCMKDAEENLQYHYSGAYAKDRAEHARISRQESQAERYGY